MVSSEQEPVFVVQHGMTARMSRCGDCGKVFTQRNGNPAVQKAFSRYHAALSPMNDAFTTKVIVELLMIRDVVAVGEKHHRDPAQLGDPSSQG